MTTQQTSTHDERMNRLGAYLERDPENVGLLAEFVDCATAAASFSAAHDALSRALELQPDNPALELRRSSLALAEGKASDALRITSSLLDEGLNEPAIVFNHASALMATGDFLEAEAALRVLDEARIPFGAVVPMRLRALHYIGDLESAITRGEAHMAEHADDALVASMLSLLHFDLDQLGPARRWADTALAINPQVLEAQIVAGQFALADEEAGRAEEHFQKAIGLHAESGRAWAGFGAARLLALDLLAARSALEQAVEFMPSHLGTWVVLGWVQLMGDDLDAAKHSFQAALALDDRFSETYGGLAAVAAKRGDFEAADQYSRIGRGLDPAGMAGGVAAIFRAQAEGRVDDLNRMLRVALTRGQSPAGGSLLEMVNRLQSRRHSDSE